MACVDFRDEDWDVRVESSVSSHLECELRASSSDLSRAISYWSGADDEVDKFDLAASSDSCVLRDVLVVLRRLCFSISISWFLT